MKPKKQGMYWYASPSMGVVVATVTRNRSGKLIAQYLSMTWPVEADIYRGVWGDELPIPDMEIPEERKINKPLDYVLEPAG